MKVELEDGDVMFYEGNAVTVQGASYLLNGMAGRHVMDSQGNITMVPESELLTEDAYLLNKCLSVLSRYEEWEAGLVTDEGDSLLENMSADNYEAMISLQADRTTIGYLLLARNRRKA